MNVLFLDQFGELGGAQRCLLDLLPALPGNGWSVHVAAPGNGDLAARTRALGATADLIHCGPYSSGHKTIGDMARFAFQTPRLVGEIRSFARRYDADLIYVNGPRLASAACLAARRGPRILFHSHSLLEGYSRSLAGSSLRRADATLVASCQFVAAPLQAYSRGRGVRVVYNGVLLNGSTRNDSSGAARIAVIGRISPEKGQAEFLRAARVLHPDLPDAKFVICGAPLFSSVSAIAYRARLEELAKDLPVEFTGWQENVNDLLSTLDLLVVPSTHVDATPRVILEAFAAGVPVVAFASGGIPEMIKDEETGFLVKEHSHEALAATMRQLLLHEPHRLREAAARAQAAAQSEFSLERYQRQMLEVMQSALRR